MAAEPETEPPSWSPTSCGLLLLLFGLRPVLAFVPPARALAATLLSACYSGDPPAPPPGPSAGFAVLSWFPIVSFVLLPFILRNLVSVLCASLPTPWGRRAQVVLKAQHSRPEVGPGERCGCPCDDRSPSEKEEVIKRRTLHLFLPACAKCLFPPWLRVTTLVDFVYY